MWVFRLFPRPPINVQSTDSHTQPLVTGTPNIRFYAGAPLRTQDGFNIGALALIDDAPREDFTPRQRHTLKEFAAIVMREMELWKDKVRAPSYYPSSRVSGVFLPPVTQS